MSSTLLALLMIGCGSSGSNTVALEPEASGNGFTVASSDIDSSQETLRIEEGQTPEDPEVNPNKPDPDLALSLDDGIGRIVGGTTATIDQFPFMVNLRIGGFTCGGTLIRQDWVLTAAHCLFDGQGRRLSLTNAVAILGRTNTNGSGGEVIGIAQAISHPSYRTSSNNNDVALVRLSRQSNQSSVSLATSSGVIQPGGSSTATGWGLTQPGSNSSLSLDQLRQVNLPLQSDSICGNIYSGYVNSTMVCAGATNSGRDTCQGDSGGPLLIRQNNAWTQVGITSFGARCGDYPGVYTEVPTFLSWINTQVGGASATPVPTPAPVPARTLGVPAAINGQLTSADPTTNPTRPGARFHDYQLTGVAAGRRVQIDFSSSQFDTYLQLVDSSTGQVLAFNDDISRSNRNSRLIFIMPSGRNLTVRATTYSSGASGSYRLSTRYR
ncbi:MAG: serine protease [Cyanophyceae cyanobacterium]